MNSAAHMMNQTTVTRGTVVSLLVSRLQVTLVAMVALVVMTSLSVIYVTNASRSLNAAIQQSLAERDQLRLQWGQLLLERGTWTMQARIQHLAEDKLGMVIPDSKSIIIISK